MSNVINLIRVTPDPKHGMTPEQWIADTIETLLEVCDEWLDEDDPFTVDHESPEQKRRHRISQVLINMVELHGRMTGIGS